MPFLDAPPVYRKLPHPRWRVPLLGDIFAFDAAVPAESVLRQYQKFGPMFEIKALGLSYVVVTGAEAIADLNDESRFCKHLGPEMEGLRLIAGNGLFTAYSDEPEWHPAHNLLVPVFNQAAMRRYHPIMLEVALELTECWDSAAARAEIVDVPIDTTRITFETIGRCLAGYKFGCFTREGTHPAIAHVLIGLVRSGRAGVFVHTYLPRFLERWARRQVRDDARYLREMADEIVARRRKDGLGHHDDMLELMLTPQADGTLPLSEDNIRSQLINFLIAGHETTSGALSFTLYFLSKHPDVFARARAEVDRVWGDAPVPEFEQVAKLRYVRRVLDESLRLQPTAPGYYRMAREDTVLAGIHPMRKGDWALAMVLTMHRDPRWGGDPTEFDPDRFAPEQVKARPAHIYKPFGTGARSCIGRQFALHEAILVLGMIIRRYDLIPDPNYELLVQERLSRMPRDFRLGLRRRAGT